LDKDCFAKFILPAPVPQAQVSGPELVEGEVEGLAMTYPMSLQ